MRDHLLDSIKGVLIYLVVLGHTVQFCGYDYQTRWEANGFWVDPVFKVIYMFHMPLFMLISGYVSYRSFGSSSLVGLVRRRALQLLLPVVAWACARCCVWFMYLLVSGAGLTLQESAWVFFREVCSSYWFLWALLAASILLFVALIIPAGKVLSVLVACCAAYLLPDFGNLHLFKYVFPFFCVGYLVAGLGDWRTHTWTRSSGGLVALSVCAVGCFIVWDPLAYVYVSKTSIEVAGWTRLVVRYFGGFIVAILFVGMCWRLLDGAHERALSSLGERSLSVYIIQTAMFPLLGELWNPLRDSVLFSLCVAPFIAAGVVLTCYWLGGLIERVPVAAFVFLGTRLRDNAR